MNSVNKTIAAVAVFLAFGTQSAFAVTNLVTNGSFESYNSSTTTFTGWTTSGTGSPAPSQAVTDGRTSGMYGDVISPDPFSYSPDTSGTNAAYFTADAANQTLSQTISLVIGQTYEVGFDLYENPSGARNSGAFTVSGLIGSTTVTTASSSSLSSGVWQHFSARFVATSTSSPTFALNFVSASGAAADVTVDDVYVTAVPEPSTVALLLVGLAGAYTWRRRRV